MLRDRDGRFQTELFERYWRMTDSVEEAVLKMYIQGVFTRKVAAVTESLSGQQVSKDTASRMTERLQDQVEAWRGRDLDRPYPYLHLDATYLKTNWGGRVTGVALLAAVGVDAEGHRELLAIRVTPGEQADAWQDLLQGLVDRSLKVVKLVISDDHEAIKAAVDVELPGVAWQRCLAYFERNALAHVATHARDEVAANFKEIFAVRRRRTAEALAEEFVNRWRSDYPRAVEIFEAGVADALTYLDFPSGHRQRIRTTNGLKRLFQEIKRRTRVVGVFPNEQGLLMLTTTVAIHVTEKWALRRYLNMELLEAHERVQNGASEISQRSRR